MPSMSLKAAATTFWTRPSWMLHALASEIAEGLHGIETTLRKAGARSFLIPELIDVGQLPAAAVHGRKFVTFASQTSIYANQELERELAPDVFLPGIYIYRIHVFPTFQGVANSATHFGFTDVTDPCVILDGLTVAGMRRSGA